ncbi:hypothetical protein JOE57_000645 [Microlunatus panaciterrae]|uniref:YrdC-like domain-containing protein n=1 Tax=Microlunatus panaciterrae TaxID=400768 RepID=A0ABS2RFF2_9ACTN|nr:hypothetical protein [Microlunatus panaciterrae]MBM7797724.1 hypothetical protein [Microlunatus panaciterrae]
MIGDGRSSGDDVVCAYPLGEVWIVEALGSPVAGGERVILGVLLALAESPLGVVAHLRDLGRAVDEPVLSELANLGRYVERWPATPIVIASPHPETSTAIRCRPHGDRLTFVPSLLQGWAHINMVDPPQKATLRIPPHPVASRLAEGFGIRTCQEWGAHRAADPARQVLRELTDRAVDVTHGDLDIRLELHRNKVRIAVRSHIPASGTFPEWPGCGLDTMGDAPVDVPTATLPAADGGLVTWAVVDL